MQGDTKHVVLGIDPGIAGTGWSVFSGWGEYLDSGTENPGRGEERFDNLARSIHVLIRRFSAVDVVVEIPSGGKWRTAERLFSYGRAVGLVEGSAVITGARVHRVTVRDWKRNTTKAQTFEMVLRSLGRIPLTDHESDAIALVMHWFQNVRPGVLRAKQIMDATGVTPSADEPSF